MFHFKKQLNSKILIGALAFVFILFGYALDARAALYNPGETLNPNCSPLDDNCDIKPAITVPSGAATGSLVYASSTNVYNSLTIGINGQILKVEDGGLKWSNDNYINALGKSGGQTIIGGTAANNALIIQANSASGNTATAAAIKFKVGDSGGIEPLTILNNGNLNIGGNINIAGDIIPATDITYSLGSPTKFWKDVYIGPGSLYVNGQKVLQTDDNQNVNVTADVNQSLVLKTFGTGDIEINPSGSGQILLKGDIRLSSDKKFVGVVNFDNLNFTENAITARNLNGGISLTPNGNGGVYITNGNFGVGTTTPTEKLDVAGNIKFSGALMPSGSAGTAGQLLVSSGSGVAPQWTSLNTSNWNTAYGWGNHATFGYVTGTPWTTMDYATGTPWTTLGYLTSETDPTYTAWNKSTGINITESQISDFGTYVTGTPWTTMDYATGTPWTTLGYLTSYDETDPTFTAWDKSTGISITESQISDFGTYVTGTPWTTLGYLTSYSETDPIFSSSSAFNISSTSISNWDTAYGWGNHATFGYVTGTPWTTLGYLTSETDPVYTAWNKSTGISITESQISDLGNYLTSYTETDPIFTSSSAFGISSTSISNWDTAYGWGNHVGLYDLVNTASGLLSTHNSTFDHAKIATSLQLNQTSPQTTVGTFTFPQIKLTTGAADGYVLTSDVNGLASWAAGGSGDVTWGPILGTITDQTDLMSNFLYKGGITGGQTIISGTGLTDILKLQGTTGNGTLTSPAIQMLVGNNGATNALTILNNGNVGIGTTTPLNTLHVNGTAGGSAGIYLNDATPSSSTNTLYNSAGDIYWSGTNLSNRVIQQASAVDTITTTSITDTQASNMIITPGAGNYTVWFSSSVKGTIGNSYIYVSVYVNGVKVTHSERNNYQESSIAGTYIPISTQAYLANVNAGDAIEIKWRVSAGTGSMNSRTMTLEGAAATGQPVLPAATVGQTLRYVSSWESTSNLYNDGVNIGINTTTPTEKLEVAGNIKFSGALMPGGLAGTTGQYLVSGGSSVLPVWTSLNTSNWNTAYGWGNHAGLYDLVNTASGLLSTHNSAFDHAKIATSLQLDQTSPQTTIGTFTFPQIKLTTGATNGYVLTSDADGSASWAAAGSGSYTLPTASDTILGGIKVGANLSIDGSGILSATGGAGGGTWGSILGTITDQTDLMSNFLYKGGITGGQAIISGTGLTDALQLQGTAGNGTLTSPAISMLVGNNGATNALTILNNGSVGVGTTSPAQKLDVVGNIRANGLIQSLSSGSGNYLFTMDAISSTGPRLQLGTLSSPANYFEIGAWSNINNFDSKDRDLKLFNSQGIIYMSNSAGGYIGIGTTNPLQKLHIVGAGVSGVATPNTASQIVLENNANSGFSILTPNTATGLVMFGDPEDSYMGGIEYDHSTDKMTFQTNNVDNVVINNMGNVGIGSTTPSVALSVDGSIYAGNGKFVGTADFFLSHNGQSLIRINSDTSSNPEIRYMMDGSTKWSMGADRADGSKFKIVYNSTLASTNKGIIINSSGNVGIGTTNPGKPLDVTGEGRFSTGLTVSSLGTGALYSNAGALTNTDPSDIDLKKNILNINNSLSKILQLRPVSFEWKDNGEASQGFIAQEVENILPELVGQNPGGSKGLYTTRFIPYIVKAIQEQQSLINSLSFSSSNALSLSSLNNLVISGGLSVSGHVSFDEDTVGDVEILGGEQEIRIIFKEKYLEKPIITVTPQADLNGAYWVSEVTADGFVIKLKETQLNDVSFYWHAFAKKGDYFVAEPEVAPILEPTPEPEITPAPETVPVVEETPVEEVEPTPEPIIESTPEPEIMPVVEEIPVEEAELTPEPTSESTPEPEVTPTPEPII